MNRYTLDFSQPVRAHPLAGRNSWPRRRMYGAFRQMLVLLSGLVCSIALLGLLRQRNQTQAIRERYETQTLQYDSLLTAKIEADRQVERLRTQLLQFSLSNHPINKPIHHEP